MKKYTLDLSTYTEDKATVEMKKELSDLLRMPGVYKDGVETCDGVLIAKQIRECEEDGLEINETELALIKKVMDTLIKKPHEPLKGQISLGGKRYEEMILRVFMLDKE